MKIKPTADELNAYVEIHRAYMLKDREDLLEYLSLDIRYKEDNEEHKAATSTFNEYLVFKRQHQGFVIADMSNMKFEGLDLSYADLANIICTHSTFSGCILANTNLSGVDFSSSAFQDNTLTKANLIGAKFTDVKIDFCMFEGAVYNEATFANAVIEKHNSGLEKINRIDK